MGFLGRKKNADGSSSTLSETEIRKKLYGEFSDRSSHVVAGERETFRGPASSSKEVSTEKDASFDLFSAQKEALSGVNVSPRRVFSETKTPETTFRPISFRSPEKKESSSAPILPAVAPARFRESQPQGGSKGAMFLEIVKGISDRVEEFFRYVMDPEQVLLRRVIYWGGAILVVFLLFWGVNSLNSQREDAMRARYKIPGETASATSPKATVPVAAPVERSAALTLAPARSSTSSVTEKRKVSIPAPSTTYVVQVVTYATKPDAEQMVKTFRRAGLRAFVKEDTRPSGRTFYQVLLGGFKTEADAQAHLAKFKSKDVSRPFQNAFVKASRS